MSSFWFIPIAGFSCSMNIPFLITQRGCWCVCVTGARRGWAGVSWLATLLNLCQKGKTGCPLAEEADRAYLKAKPLTGFPKVIQHDIDDRHLVDARSINFHHRLRISLLLLKEKNIKCVINCLSRIIHLLVLII